MNHIMKAADAKAEWEQHLNDASKQWQAERQGGQMAQASMEQANQIGASQACGVVAGSHAHVYYGQNDPGHYHGVVTMMTAYITDRGDLVMDANDLNAMHGYCCVQIPEGLWYTIKRTRAQHLAQAQQMKMAAMQAGLGKALPSLASVLEKHIPNRPSEDGPFNLNYLPENYGRVSGAVMAQQPQNNGGAPAVPPAKPTGPLHTPQHKTVHPPLAGATREQGFPNKPKLPKFF